MHPESIEPGDQLAALGPFFFDLKDDKNQRALTASHTISGACKSSFAPIQLCQTQRFIVAPVTQAVFCVAARWQPSCGQLKADETCLIESCGFDVPVGARPLPTPCKVSRKRNLHSVMDTAPKHVADAGRCWHMLRSISS